MLLKCERCGAPLEVPPGGAVRCPYCGTTASAPAPVAPPPAPNYEYERQMQQARARAAVRPVRASRSGGIALGVMIALGVLGSLSASLIPRLMSAGSSADVQQVLSQATRGISVSSIGWDTGDPGCLIDANGDGVRDIAGLTGPSETNQATVVDGSTGAVLFTAPAVKKADQLGCLGEGGFFVVEGNFQVDFYTARSPWGKTAVMARDKVDAYGLGAGCVQLKTADGTTQGIQLPSGVASNCPATLHSYYGAEKAGVMGLTDDSTELSVGTRSYKLTKRASGTSILTLRVSEGSRQILSKELPYATCTFGAAVAPANGKILLWAAQPSDRDKGLIVGLDEATGNQLYEVPVTDSSSDNPRLFQFNGKYVLAVSWGALRAYDPATGAEVWRVGR